MSSLNPILKCANHKDIDSIIWVQIGLQRYGYCNKCWGKIPVE